MRRRFFGLVFSLAVVLSGCGSSATTTTVTVSTPAASAPKTTTAASSPPVDIATAARELASICVPAAESAEQNPPGVEPKVQALIAAYTNDPSAPGARNYLKIAEENLKDGCGSRYAGELAAILSTAAPSGTPNAASPSATVVATGHASGEYAIAQASGTASNPSRLALDLAATPAQSAKVSWTLVCQESGGGVGSKSGQSTLQLPTTSTLPLPAPSESCIVSANAQLSGSGTVKISIYD